MNSEREADGENMHGVNGINGDGLFDPAAPPPFKIADIRVAIPKHCWIKDPWRSMSYVLRDVIVVFALAAAAIYIDAWFIWPLDWAAQGTMFWAIFLLGHECGHGSFSDSARLNSVVSHILHTSILVPYHGWRISHRIHYQNHGHVGKDESWDPVTFQTHLWKGLPGRGRSHFNPNSPLFSPSERELVVKSTLCWSVMAAVLICLSFVLGPIQMFKLYWVPYIIFTMWYSVVTYLHHNDHEQKLPYYRGKEWSYLRGALTTIDRDYGIFNGILHDAGTHVIHHLFPQIPHYHLVEATKAARPVLGKYYRKSKKSGPIPIHLIRSLVDSLKHDHYVSDSGEIVYYQTDPELDRDSPSKKTS